MSSGEGICAECGQQVRSPSEHDAATADTRQLLAAGRQRYEALRTAIRAGTALTADDSDFLVAWPKEEQHYGHKLEGLSREITAALYPRCAKDQLADEFFDPEEERRMQHLVKRHNFLS